MEKALKIQIIIGSTRKNRFSERSARYFFDELKKKEGVEAELVDLREWPLPFYDEASSPSSLKGNYESELAKKWAAKIAEADAYIIVTPEYNHGYPAVLKNALDWVFYEWKDKPVGFVSYGNVNGARAVEQLRQVVIELYMHPIRNSIHIPVDIFRSMVGGKSTASDAELFKPMREGPTDRVDGFFNDLITLAKKLKQKV